MTLDNSSEEVPSKKRRFSYVNGMEKNEDEMSGEPIDSSVSFVYSFYTIQLINFIIITIQINSFELPQYETRKLIEKDLRPLRGEIVSGVH